MLLLVTPTSNENSVWSQGRLGKAGHSPRILFGQVREDAAVELCIARGLPPGESFFCIASGGCTALALLAATPAVLHAVDINPAQVFLVELKKAALGELAREDLLRCILNDARPFYPRLRPRLSSTARTFWDESEFLLGLGLNNCGLIDIRLRQLTGLLPLVQSRRQVRRLFGASSVVRRRQIYARHWDHWHWRLGFRLLLNRAVLSLAYGPQFTRALPNGFADGFRLRVERTLLDFPLGGNAYAWATFLGGYPRDEAGWPPYLQRENECAVRAGLARVQLACADAADYLEALAPAAVSFFALSNILEIASPTYAQRLLRAVTRSAKPGARVVLRSIFGFEDALFARVPELRLLPSQVLEAEDRSFFCNKLRVLEVAPTN